MSTTFGVKIPGYDEIEEVAFRGGGLWVKNPVILLCPDETPLIAMDNTNQGIDTVGDLKKELAEQEKRLLPGK